MRHLLSICLFLAHVGAASAQDEWILASGQTRILAGADFTVTLVHSGGTTEAMPDSVVCKLSGEGPATELRLSAVTPPAGDALGKRSVRRDYQAKLPAEVEGLVTLELSDRPSTKLLLLAEKALQEKPPSADPVARMSGHAAVVPKAATPPVATPALTSYEPMYFLVGTRQGANARFQLSFKYRLFDDAGVVVGALPFLSGLHIAYTQTSLWDLADNSKPFRDTSYRPAAFYQWQGGAPVGAHAGWTVQAGVEHESNGRDGDSSRSINTAFVHPDWRFHFGDAWYVGVAPKLFAYLDKQDNPDIDRYRGHVNLGLLLGQDDGWLFSSIVRRGKSGYGSVQLDASYPLRKPFFADTGGFVHFQYFNGYGETILDYNLRRTPQFRVGFSIVR